MSDQNSFTKDFIEELERCAGNYSDNNNAISSESKTIFKGQVETFDNVRLHNIDIYHNSYIVRFCYYPHIPFTTSHSVLTCFISLEKAESQRLFYPVSHICAYIGICLKNALTIPLILSTTSMKECFDFILEDLKAIIPQIQDLSYDTERKAVFFNQEVESAVLMLKREYPTDDEMQKLLIGAKEEWYPLWKAEQGYTANDSELQTEFDELMTRYLCHVQSLMYEDKQKFLDYYYNFIASRAVGSAAEAYMTGNYAESLKKFKKQKYITAYEKVLISYMDTAKIPRPHVPESIYKNITELYKNGIPKNNFKESLAIAPAMLLFGLIWLPLFLAVYFLFYFIESRDSIYLLGSLENAPSAMLPALLCGIVMIYFNSKRFYKLFFRKNHQRLIELDNAVNSRSTRQFMKGLTFILIIGSIVFLALTVHQNIKMTETGIYDNTNFWSVRGDYYSYDEIDKVYYRAQTPNGYGDMLDMPSYVILFKNGNELDPYRLNTCDEKFLNTLQDKNIFVESP